MPVDRARRAWLLAMNANVRAVHAHQVAAALYERVGDRTRAQIESERAVIERRAYVHAAAQHPEWSADLSSGLLDSRGAGVRRRTRG
jgi:hypothetical protein